MEAKQVSSNATIATKEKQNLTAPTNASGQRHEPRINFSNPNLIRAKIVDGKTIVPANWRDEDDD